MSTPTPPGPPAGPPPGPAQPGGWIPVGAGAPPVVPTVAGGGRRRGRPVLVGLGVLLIVAGIGGAIALVVAGSQRLTDGVEKLARGPANCVTTLDVAKDATYYFYVETKGELGDVRGNCPAIGETFDVDGDSRARLSLQDEDGESVRLERADGVTYDSGGYRGELVRVADLEEGSYQLAVEADDGVAVAVGADVDGLKMNVVLPIIIGVVGLVLGLLAILFGRRGGAPAAPVGGAQSFSPSGTTAAGPFAGTGLAAPGQPVPGPSGGWGAPPPPGG